MGSRRARDALADLPVDRRAVGHRLRDRPPGPLGTRTRRRALRHGDGARRPLLRGHRLHARRALAHRVDVRGKGHARWREFIPVDRERRAGLVPMLQFYLFARRGRSAGGRTQPARGSGLRARLLLYVVMIVTGLGMYATDAVAGSPVALGQGPAPPLRRRRGRALDPPRHDVAAARLLRPPPLQRAAHVRGRAQRDDGVHLHRVRSGCRASSSSVTRGRDERSGRPARPRPGQPALRGRRRRSGGHRAASRALRGAAGRRRPRRRDARPVAAAVPAPGAQGLLVDAIAADAPPRDADPAPGRRGGAGRRPSTLAAPGGRGGPSRRRAAPRRLPGRARPHRRRTGAARALDRALARRRGTDRRPRPRDRR